MNPRNFFSELKRRNVYKVAVAYAVVGWLVVQISSTVLPTFHAPEWVVQTLVVLVALGFPIALVIAWAFELTPEGLKRTEDVDPFDSRSGQVLAAQTRTKSHAWIFVVIIAGVMSLGLFFLGRFTAPSKQGGAPACCRTRSRVYPSRSPTSRCTITTYRSSGAMDSSFCL